MKRHFTFLLLSCLISWMACSKASDETLVPEGTWVEVSKKTDTLTFDLSTKIMVLKRGTELRNGYLLPKYSSGPYLFELGDGSISIRWMASSTMGMNQYPLKINQKLQQLQIGNFFMENVDQSTLLTFQKIR